MNYTKINYEDIVFLLLNECSLFHIKRYSLIYCIIHYVTEAALSTAITWYHAKGSLLYYFITNQIMICPYGHSSLKNFLVTIQAQLVGEKKLKHNLRFECQVP